jgi:WD40 repeat protein
MFLALTNIFSITLSGHYDFKVRVWNLETRELKFCLDGHTDFVLSVAIWKGCEKFVISGSSDSTIKIWDYIGGELVRTLSGHVKDVWGVTCTTGPSPLIVSGGTDRTGVYLFIL